MSNMKNILNEWRDFRKNSLKEEKETLNEYGMGEIDIEGILDIPDLSPGRPKSSEEQLRGLRGRAKAGQGELAGAMEDYGETAVQQREEPDVPDVPDVPKAKKKGRRRGQRRSAVRSNNGVYTGPKAVEQVQNDLNAALPALYERSRSATEEPAGSPSGSPTSEPAARAVAGDFPPQEIDEQLFHMIRKIIREQVAGGRTVGDIISDPAIAQAIRSQNPRGGYKAQKPGPFKVDNRWGPRTDAAVKVFQYFTQEFTSGAHSKLAVDGIIGPNTARVLKQAAGGTPQTPESAEEGEESDPASDDAQSQAGIEWKVQKSSRDEENNGWEVLGFLRFLAGDGMVLHAKKLRIFAGMIGSQGEDDPRAIWIVYDPTVDAGEEDGGTWSHTFEEALEAFISTMGPKTAARIKEIVKPPKEQIDVSKAADPDLCPEYDCLSPSEQ